MNENVLSALQMLVKSEKQVNAGKTIKQCFCLKKNHSKQVQKLISTWSHDEILFF